MLMIKFYLKVLVVKILFYFIELGVDVGIFDIGDVYILIIFEFMGLDGKCYRCKFFRCLGDNFFNFYFLFYV